jgi:hypothetical protein
VKEFVKQEMKRQKNIFNYYGSGYVMFRTAGMEEKTAKISRIICKIYNVFVHGDEVTL